MPVASRAAARGDAPAAHVSKRLSSSRRGGGRELAGATAVCCGRSGLEFPDGAALAGAIPRSTGGEGEPAGAQALARARSCQESVRSDAQPQGTGGERCSTLKGRSSMAFAVTGAWFYHSPGLAVVVCGGFAAARPSDVRANVR